MCTGYSTHDVTLHSETCGLQKILNYKRSICFFLVNSCNAHSLYTSRSTSDGYKLTSLVCMLKHFNSQAMYCYANEVKHDRLEPN